MEYRQLGNCGLRVSALTLGTMTFGGTGWAKAVGRTDVDGAKRQIAQAVEAGVNMIDTADVYSAGRSEEIGVFEVSRALLDVGRCGWLRSVIVGVGWWGCGSRRRCGLQV